MDWLVRPPADLLDEVLHAKLDTGEHVDAGSAAVRRDVLREIADAQSEIRDLVAMSEDGRVAVHRAITLTPDGLARLAPGDALGICWAFEGRGAHPYDGKAGRPTFVVSAWANPGDIVGDHTLAMWSSGEGEARLARRALVEIVAVRDAEGRDVRPDLAGAEFGTGLPVPAAPNAGRPPRVSVPGR